MDVVVKGRNVEVPEHFRVHVTEKLSRVERYDNKIIEIDVELLHERNPRQSDNCQRVEITCVSRGPVVRAEACAPDFYAALDHATEKLESRLRRSSDRRRVHHGRHAPVSVALATARAEAVQVETDQSPVALAVREAEEANEVDEADEAEHDQPWHLARAKAHPSEPMTVDDALFQMELVGHDFYLFLDKDSGRPSVVYRRRKGYDYGVISLSEPAA